jgi:hypothetical protein
MIGVAWIVYLLGRIAAFGDGKPGSINDVYAFVIPLVLLWWPTGVYKHIIAWFKGGDK